MYAITKAEAFKVIGFNVDGSQMMLDFAPSLEALLISFGKEIVRHESMGAHNILPTFTKIAVATVDGFIGLELPYIPTVKACLFGCRCLNCNPLCAR